MTTATAEDWEGPLREASRGAAQAGVETLSGARPALLNSQSAAALTSLVLAAFVCAAAVFRTRLAAGQIDLIASALRVSAVAFLVRALLSTGELVRTLLRDGSAQRATLALGADGLLLRVGELEQSARRGEVLAVAAREALQSRSLTPRPMPISCVLTPREGRPRTLTIPPYFAQTTDILEARLRRWLGKPAANERDAPRPPPDEAPEAHYERAARGQLDAGDVVIPEGRGYLLRAPYAALLGLWFALDLFYSAGPSRELIALPVLGASLLSLFAIVAWFVWLRRRQKSRLGIGMLLSEAELLLRGPHGVVSVPWPQLAEVDVQVSARWSPFVGTYAARVLHLTTHTGERMLFDGAFLSTPVEVVAVLCRTRARLSPTSDP